MPPSGLHGGNASPSSAYRRSSASPARTAGEYRFCTDTSRSPRIRRAARIRSASGWEKPAGRILPALGAGPHGHVDRAVLAPAGKAAPAEVALTSASRITFVRMRIGELAARAGTTTRTLRYYESRGLLPARRGGNGYRTYDEADLKLLRQIRTLQDFGFDLEETRPFVECLRAGHPEGDSCPASLEVYRRKLDELDELIGELQAVRAKIGVRLVTAEATEADVEPPLCELGGHEL